ncbi:MAG: LuxR C-terminal-related transcriptional regulator [Prolixibacteraceae bacterium]
MAFIFAFIISAAATTFGLLLSNNLRKQHAGQTIFSTLLYEQIFVFIFALYSIWGFIFFKLIFSTEVLSESLVEKISSVQTIIAIPFQLFSWWFLIQLIFELVQIKNIRRNSTLVLAALIILLFPVYWFFFKKSAFHFSIFPLYCIVNSMVYSFIFITLLISKKTLLKKNTKLIAALFIWISGLLLSAGTLFYSMHILLTLVFIVLFFILNLWPVLIIARFVSIAIELPTNQVDQDFEALSLFYEISKREVEIIELICEGLTNQQIADSLFISLQTVKDHTSRIYLKTQVKNRTQLANLFRKNS